MGLIALVWMGGFLLIAGLLTLAYIVVVYNAITNKTINTILKPLIIIPASVIATFLFLGLYQYYTNNPDMICFRGFFGLAPKFSETINLKSGDYILNYTRNTDYNSGARGGARIKSSLSLIQNEKQKEIELIIFNKIYVPYKLPDQTIEVRKKDDRTIHYIDIFIDPKRFTMDEFKIIGDILIKNSEKIEQIIDHSNSLSSTSKFSRLSSIYYLNRKTLERNYKCKNDITIKLTENGKMFAYSTKPKSTFSKSKKIGKAINNGTEISLYRQVYTIDIINTRYKHQLVYPEATIEECYDTNRNNLFEEFIFSNQTVPKQKH